MRHPPLAPGWIDRPHHELSIGDLPLESGETLRDCGLVWVEHGERSATGDNVVLALCAIGSTHHRLDFLIGEGRALDPARYHVVVVDALGNGLSSSPSNSALQPGASFPRITIGDMVESQRRLLDALRIGRLRAVVGASMGGMQALQWAPRHPERMDAVVALTAPGRTAPWSRLMNELSRRALFEDDAFTRPRQLRAAMALWVPLTQMAVARSPDALARFAGEGSLSSTLAELEERFVANPPDPFNWLAQTRAYDAHDVSGSLDCIRARCLLAAPPLDLYNPARDVRETAAAIAGARFMEIASPMGHRSATDTRAEDAAALNDAIRAFLDTSPVGDR